MFPPRHFAHALIEVNLQPLSPCYLVLVVFFSPNVVQFFLSGSAKRSIFIGFSFHKITRILCGGLITFGFIVSIARTLS